MNRKLYNRRSYRGENNPNYRHGYTVNGESHIYMVWADMKRRASSEGHQRFPDYVLRGIGICEAWMEFENFILWAEKNGYKRGLCIDRINNDKGYSPDNCRFITNLENVRNGRKAKINVKIASKIKTLLALKEGTYRDIANLCGCSVYIVADISKRRTWRDVI
jgi:hypothetical protein